MLSNGKFDRKLQTAFVEGRHIMENVATAQEFINYCHNEKITCTLLQLYFIMAFNSIEWNVSVDTLKARGLTSKWMS